MACRMLALLQNVDNACFVAGHFRARRLLFANKESTANLDLGLIFISVT